MGPGESAAIAEREALDMSRRRRLRRMVRRRDQNKGKFVIWSIEPFGMKVPIGEFVGLLTCDTSAVGPGPARTATYHSRLCFRVFAYNHVMRLPKSAVHAPVSMVDGKMIHVIHMHCRL